MSTITLRIIGFIVVAVFCALIDVFAICLVTILKDRDNAIDDKNEENNNESK